MNSYLKRVPRTSFKQPSRDLTEGKRVAMPRISGLGLRAATKKLEKAGFTVEDRYVYSTRPAGTFMGWSERGGSVVQFATLYILRSNGKEDPAIVAARKAEARERREAAAERRADREEAADERRKAADERREAAADRREAAADRARDAREQARKAEEKKAAAAKPPPAPKPPPKAAPAPKKPGG